ncbi:MAG: rod shape-determining protein RodA [Opitutales bacterium]|nr:rod shape-determining protein RodA [Opitutales bacterium]MBP3358073.1 rod shape-determining protein RodA [Opitutales bacterium]
MKSQAEIYGEVPKERGVQADFVVPICMLVLFFIGIVFIYSAQSYTIDAIPLQKQFWVKQIFYVGIAGVSTYVILGWTDYKWVFTYSNVIYFLSILLLLPLTLKETFGIPIPFIETRFNATRWINFGMVSIQPSELAKIGTCIMAAAMFARNRGKKNLKFWIKIGLVFFVPILLIFLQPDLGSTLVFFPMLFAMLYISNLPKRFFVAVLLVFCVLMGLVSADIYGYNSFLKSTGMSASEASRTNAYGTSASFCLPIKDYQRNRILAFVAPDIIDPRGNGVSWNQRQSLISVGSGGVLGKGVAEGTQAKLGYLPSSVAYNDFIFSVLAEESGFAGAVFTIVLMAVIIIYGCLGASQRSRDKFGQYLCVGIGVILMTHTFINVGMTVGIMPITGLPLPMLSYGGTFVLTCSILLGLVQSVYRHRKEYA